MSIDPTHQASTPAQKAAWRTALIRMRQDLAHRGVHDHQQQLAQVMHTWLSQQPDTVVAAYWPIQAEFDPLPTLALWQQTALLARNAQRRIGLPVVNRVNKTLSFHAWHPNSQMAVGAYGIAQPQDAEQVHPSLVFVPCVGYGPRGHRLGYGAGYYDRTLSVWHPAPFTVGLCYDFSYLEHFAGDQYDVPLNAVLSECGLVWGA